MSDTPIDTPILGRRWCPGCEPDADPLREILREDWCCAHPRTTSGPDDGLVTIPMIGIGSVEAEGENCRAAAALLHRG